MKKIVIFLMGFAVVAFSSFGQVGTECGASNKAFDVELSEMMDSLGVVGLSVAVVKDNEIIYNNSYGVQDIVTKEPVTNDTFFRIASISKSFSAVSIMQLVERGLVTLNTDVNEVLPFKVRNPKYPETPITVEMLLSHTSSLNDSEGYWETLNCVNPEKNENYVRAYNDYKPGTGYEYCNLNFSLLGSIIERLSGERFDGYMAHHIVMPLGVTASFNINDIPAEKIGKLYSWNGEEYVEQSAYRPVTNLEAYQLTESSVTFSPAGGMKISARDLAKYMMMHMNYGKMPQTGVRVLSEESAKQMQVDHTGGQHYGLALTQTDKYTPGEVMVGHTGGAYGLRSAMFFNPAAKHGLVMICSGCKNPSVVLERIMPILYRHFIK